MKTLIVLGIILIGFIFFISKNKSTFKTIVIYIIVIIALMTILILLNL